MGIKRQIKYWLWEHSLYDNKCPDCGSDLMGHGYDENTVYTCTNENCNFGKKEKNL